MARQCKRSCDMDRPINSVNAGLETHSLIIPKYVELGKLRTPTDTDPTAYEHGVIWSYFDKGLDYHGYQWEVYQFPQQPNLQARFTSPKADSFV